MRALALLAGRAVAGAAREQVRVPRRLEDLPQVARAYGDGRISYSKVRAITRVAEPQDGIDWCEHARHCTAAQLEQVVRGVRRAKAHEQAQADPEAAAWQLRTRVRYDDAGNFSLTVSGPAEFLPVLLQAGIEAKKAELQRPQDTQTDAAVTAEQSSHPGAVRRRRPRLTAQIDPLSGWGRQADGELLPPTSLRAVMKALPGRGGLLRLRPVTAADLRRHDLGRTAREANTALRELLGTVDGERCRFPGCTRRKRLHAHHVVYWSDGGGTDLDNLVLVCARHHTLIHSQDFRLVLHPDRRLEVATAEGVALLHHPAQPWADPAETLPPDHVEPRIDLGYVVNVLVAQAS